MGKYNCRLTGFCYTTNSGMLMKRTYFTLLLFFIIITLLGNDVVTVAIDEWTPYFSKKQKGNVLIPQITRFQMSSATNIY